MENNLALLARKAGALLCAGLILVFVQAGVASAVGDVEHLIVGHHAHQHMLFSDLALDFHHDAADADGSQHDLGQKAPDHHHHHGDLGSSNVLPVSSPDTSPQQIGFLDPPASGHVLTKTQLAQPERPPRTGYIAA